MDWCSRLDGLALSAVVVIYGTGLNLNSSLIGFVVAGFEFAFWGCF